MTIKEELELKLEQYTKAAEMYERDVDYLIDQYGTGSRPSWVSAEISTAMALAAQYKVRAQEMRDQLDKL